MDFSAFCIRGLLEGLGALKDLRPVTHKAGGIEIKFARFSQSNRQLGRVAEAKFSLWTRRAIVAKIVLENGSNKIKHSMEEDQEFNERFGSFEKERRESFKKEIDERLKEQQAASDLRIRLAIQRKEADQKRDVSLSEDRKAVREEYLKYFDEDTIRGIEQDPDCLRRMNAAMQKYGARGALELNDSIEKSNIDFLIGMINLGLSKRVASELIVALSESEVFLLYNQGRVMCEMTPRFGVVVFAFTREDHINRFRKAARVPNQAQHRKVFLKDFFWGPFNGSPFTLYLNPEGGVFDLCLPREVIREVFK